jgi:hypothetical protein
MTDEGALLLHISPHYVEAHNRMSVIGTNGVCLAGGWRERLHTNWNLDIVVAVEESLASSLPLLETISEASTIVMILFTL